MTPDRDAALFADYKALLDAEPADLDLDDLMAAAETAEAGGELAFLSDAPAFSPVPARLLTRAEALAPRDAIVPSRPFWQQWAVAIGTVLAFGSGSYALAATFTAEDTSDSWSVDEGLYDTAIGDGLFTFE